MKKAWYKLRLVIHNAAVLLVLALQLGVAVGFLVLLDVMDATGYVYLCILLVVYVVSLIFLFHLLYSQEDPEFKIPWIVILLFIPGVGVAVYLIFKQRGLRRHQRENLEKIRSSFAPFFKERITADKKYATSDYQPITFLENAGEFSAHKNNKLTYYKCGEDFFPDFIQKLKEAKEFIFMEFFIVRKGREWDQIHEILRQKAKEGVEIRLLYDDFGCFNYLPSSYAKHLRDEGISCYRFNKVGFLLRGSYNNRTHRKIAVIDHQYGFTGGMNLGDEYANDISEFGYWKDTMICVEGDCINNMIALFLENFDINRGQVSDYAKYLDYQYPQFESDSLVYFFGTGPSNICPIRKGEQNYVNIIESANETVSISTPYLIPSLDLLHSMQRAAYRGVDVRLIVPGIPDKKLIYLIAKYYFPPLLESGVKIYTYTPGFNHMKTILADDRTAFVGTINMDYRSLVHHFECGITLVNDPSVQDIKDDFEDMINKSALVPQNFSLTTGQKIKCTLLRIFMPLM